VGPSALAVGNTADASTTNATAVGYNATASGIGATGLGSEADASGYLSTAVGVAAGAAGERSIALGSVASVSANDSIGIGTAAVAAFTNSVALGRGTVVTGANQIRMGTTEHHISIPGHVSGATLSNSVMVATTRLQGITQWDVAALDTLANGNNAGVDPGGATFLKISTGPTAAFAIAGITGGADGRLLTIYNSTAHNLSILHQSGVDATPANRIVTMTGADVATTGAGTVQLMYDSGASRWLLISSAP
jgi:hypothetical protein